MLNHTDRQRAAGLPTRLAWLPIPLFLLIIAALWAAGPRASHESAGVLILCNLLFFTLASFAIVFLLIRNFLAEPLPGTLLLGCGILVWGLGSLAAPIAGQGDVNLTFTIHNLSVWLAACFQLAGVSISRRPLPKTSAAGIWAGVACAVSLTLVGLIALATLSGSLPVFFIQGRGGTLARQYTLVSAISLLILTTGLMRPEKGSPASPFTVWYANGLLLLAVGLFGVMIQSVSGSLLGWTARAAQYLGGIYMIAAVFATNRRDCCRAILPDAETGRMRQRYLTAAVIVITCVALRLVFLQGLGKSAPYVTFYPAVIVAALYGGIRSGILATLLSALMADYYFIEPAGFGIENSTDWLALAAFLLGCLMISWITGAMLRAREQANEAEAQARLAAERELVAERLQSERDLLQAVMDGAKNSHLVYLDRDFNFVRVNETYARTCGYRPEEMIGRNHFELYPHAENKAIFTRVRDTGESFEIRDKPFEFPDQPERGVTYWDWSLIPVKEADGQVTGLIFSLFETTGRKRAEEALLRAQSELEKKVAERTAELVRTVEVLHAEIRERRELEQQLLQSQKMESIGVLAGGVAHDFNNLLSGIQGFAEIIQENISRDDELLRDSIEQVLKASTRAAELTRSLLAFSRKQAMDPKPVLIDDIVANTAKLIKRVIGEDIEIITEFHGAELPVLADAGQMEQVLMNLATNARDAMPGGGCLSISLRKVAVKEGNESVYDLPSPGDYALISVIDTGAGIEQNALERIFEPFYTTKEVGKGTGLGLSIVYGIVKQHSGSVLVNSLPGKGTRVEIYLPLTAGLAVAEEREAPSSAAGGSETLLIAEDEEIVRDLMKRILGRAGFRVLVACDGEEALALFRENNDISLVLSDLVMPRKTGREMLREMRKVRPDIRVIFISGYASDAMHVKGVMEDKVEIITKPIRKNDLLARIRQVLDRG